MYCIFEINFNRAQQQIKMNTASVRNIFFLMKSTEIHTTMMYRHIQDKRRHFSQKFPIYTDCTFCRGIPVSNIILILQQHDTHVVEVQQDKNHFKS